jgi:hypothetical protein
LFPEQRLYHMPPHGADFGTSISDVHYTEKN